MIRSAEPADVGTIRQLAVDLAVYEREPDAVEMTEQMLHDALFVEGTAHCEVAVDDAGDTVGFALWFPTFSTWTGRAGIHLEDLYVRPEARGGGYGKALLARLAQICLERGWARLEWNALEWNEPAIGFYRALGARQVLEWLDFRLVDDSLRAVAGLT